MLLSDQDIRDIVDEVVDNIMDNYKRVINYTNNELYEEATNMYNTFIQQFYLYKTSTYIRHWETRPGTRKGSNLYYGGRSITKRQGKNPTLTIEFSSKDMAEGYEYDSAQSVLNLVMSGIRFPYNEMTWTGEYDGKYFKYRGVMSRAFELFEENFDDIAERIFFSEWDKIEF